MRETPSRLLPLVAAACAGVTAWLSLGSLAITPARSGVMRLGFLPPLWLLLLLVLAAVTAARFSRLPAPTARPLFFTVVLVLPWLPFRVPAAFLLWTGHLVVAVWIAVGAAVLAARGVRPPHWFGDARWAPWIAALVACALYLITAHRIAELIPSGDEPHYLVITQSLLKDGDLQIENNHAQADHREYFPGQLNPDFLRRGTNGQIYSIHAPGLSVVVAPAFALFGYPGVVVFLAIVAAIGSGLLWRASYLLSGKSGAAWFGWAAGALTVPFFFQSFAVYPDGLGATLMLFAAMPLLQTPEATQAMSRFRWFAIGAVLAVLPWLHTRFAVLAGALGLLLSLRLFQSRERRSHLAALLAAPLAGALAWFGFFRIIYGTFNPSAPYRGETQTALGTIPTALPALLFDQQFGILPNAPVYAICFAGLLGLARRRPRLAVELLAISIPYLLLTSMFHMWWAGTVSPARLLVPVLPLLAVPGAWLWGETRHAATRAMAISLLLLSIGITLSLAVVDAGRLVYNFRDGYSLAAERLSPLVDVPQGLPSFFRQSPGGGVLRAAIWVIAILGAWFILRGVERRSTNVRSALALATPACLAAAMMVALTVQWRLDRVSAMTADTSQLDVLSQYDPNIRPLGITLAPLALESPEAILSRIAISTSQRRPALPSRTLFMATGVIPAGEYELRPKTTSSVPDGTVTLVSGRLAKPIRRWNLATDLRGAALTFTLPVNVRSIVVDGEGAAAKMDGLELIPKRITTGSARVSDLSARRAERYGRVIAYFFDGGAFPEEPGFWIRGGTRSTVALAPEDPTAPLLLFLRNAPVKNRLTLDIDGQQQVFELQPNEERMIPLHLSHDRAAAVIHVRTDAGFRPSEVERGSTDYRFLGTWIEIRQ